MSTEKSRSPESDAGPEIESRRRLATGDRAAAGATLVVVAPLLAGAVSAALAMG